MFCFDLVLYDLTHILQGYNDKTLLLHDMVTVPQAADCRKEAWWTISQNYIVLFLSCDVKTTKFNQ